MDSFNAKSSQDQSPLNIIVYFLKRLYIQRNTQRASLKCSLVRVYFKGMDIEVREMSTKTLFVKIVESSHEKARSKYDAFLR